MKTNDYLVTVAEMQTFLCPKITITEPATKCLQKTDIVTNFYVNTSQTTFASYPNNRLVPYQYIQGICPTCTFTPGTPYTTGCSGDFANLNIEITSDCNDSEARAVAVGNGAVTTGWVNVYLGTNTTAFNAIHTGTYYIEIRKKSCDGGVTQCTSVSTSNYNHCCNFNANWVNNGSTFCSGCNLYQPQIDNNFCSATYLNTRNVDLGPSTTCCYRVYNAQACCSGGNAVQLVFDGNHNAGDVVKIYGPGQPEHDKCYTILSDQYQGTNASYTINGDYINCDDCCPWYYVYYCNNCDYRRYEQNCCGNTRNDVLIEANSSTCGTWNTQYYCNGCDYRSREVNSCSGAIRNDVLVESNSTQCGGCCGQSTTPNWINDGSIQCGWYLASLGITGLSDCHKYQPQKDFNPCSPTGGTYRYIDQGDYSTSTGDAGYCCYTVMNLYYPCGSTTPATQQVPAANLDPGLIIKASNGLCYTTAGTQVQFVAPNQSVNSDGWSSCNECNGITTTTTTTPSPYYYYNAYRFECNLPAGPCLAAGEVIIRSSSALSTGSWYSDGSYAYQPYSTTVNTSYSWDADGYLYTQASTCSIACINY